MNIELAPRISGVATSVVMSTTVNQRKQVITPQQVLANVKRWRAQHGLDTKPSNALPKPKALPKFEKNTIKLSQNSIILDIDPNTGEVMVAK